MIRLRIKKTPRSNSGLGHQSAGMALVIGMIFLLITSLMALTAMSGVVMQERMAGNLRNVSVAKAAAESALRAGEMHLGNVISRGDEINGDCDGGAHHVFNRADPGCNTVGVDAFRESRDAPGNAGGIAQYYPAALISEDELDSPEYASMAARPMFLIEHMGEMYSGAGHEWESSGGYDTQAARVYRITGRGTGVSSNVIRVVESHYAMFAGGGSGTCPDGVTPIPAPPASCP